MFASAATDALIQAAVCGVVALATYIAAPRVRAPSRVLSADLEAGSPEFLATIVGVTGTPVLAGNDVRILNDGDEFFTAMLADIRAAQASVTMEAYICWAGDIAREFAETCGERGRRGVPVKLLLDSVGSATIGDEILNVLEAGTCQVAWFNPIHWYTLDRFNFRTHRRSLIIDGRVAYTGGAAIADQWRGHAQGPDHWRDIQVRIEGPGAVPLQSGFAQNWLKTTGELVIGAAFFPEPDAAGSVPVLNLLSSPQTGMSAARLLYDISIGSARRSILIANSYFIPDPLTIGAFVEARRRGVAVKILVSGVRNDQRLARLNSVRLYGPLLTAGVEIYEYQPTMLHQKVMIVDDVWATIGTTNFDTRSFALNEENNLCFVERRLVAELRETFFEDLKAAEPVRLATWRKRGWMTRGFEVAASFLQEQM